jgi:programmed cell death protein 5
MDYEEIKQRKMEELKRNAEQQDDAEKRQQEAESQVSALMRKLLDEKALERMNNIRLVNRELHLNAAQTILYLYRAGRIQGKMSEEELKELLQKIGSKKEINIKRK